MKTILRTSQFKKSQANGEAWSRIRKIQGDDPFIRAGEKLASQHCDHPLLGQYKGTRNVI